MYTGTGPKVSRGQIVWPTKETSLFISTVNEGRWLARCHPFILQLEKRIHFNFQQINTRKKKLKGKKVVGQIEIGAVLSKENQEKIGPIIKTGWIV